MFSDWLAQTRRARPAAPPAPDPAGSLAVGVLELCDLCEDLLTLVAAQDAARPLLATVPERLEAVRASAGAVRARSAAADPDDTYSLPALSRWVWREDQRRD